MKDQFFASFRTMLETVTNLHGHVIPESTVKINKILSTRDITRIEAQCNTCEAKLKADGNNNTGEIIFSGGAWLSHC